MFLTSFLEDNSVQFSQKRHPFACALTENGSHRGVNLSADESEDTRNQ